MCLAQTLAGLEGDRSGDTSRLCVKEQKFLGVEDIDPEGLFPENGIIGLSPGKSERSVLNTLKRQGVIDKEVLAISLEANEHHITFGSIELPNINSSDVTNHTLHYFSNLDIKLK